MVIIRQYEERDFDDYVSTLEKTTDWGREAGEELKARMEKMRKDEQIWVAEVENRAVGFMILAYNDDGSLEVDWLDVYPSHQRRGLATLLVEKAARIAEADKRQELSVHTHVTNKEMMTFLTKNGFKVFKKIKDFYGEKKDALQFKKTLR
jgi:ribosomal protein S18 acetylase RimI-like enzyme